MPEKTIPPQEPSNRSSAARLRIIRSAPRTSAPARADMM